MTTVFPFQFNDIQDKNFIVISNHKQKTPTKDS